MLNEGYCEAVGCDFESHTHATLQPALSNLSQHFVKAPLHVNTPSSINIV